MLGKLFSPKVALKLLLVEIRNRTNVKIVKYQMFYKMGSDVMEFRIFHPETNKMKKTNFDDPNVIHLLSEQIKSKVKDVDNLVAFMIEYNHKETCWLTLFEKEKGKQKLNKYEI